MDQFWGGRSTVSGNIDAAYIRGRLDALIEFDDGTYGIIDFKTSTPKPEAISFYSRQLHAYAIALERSAPEMVQLSPIHTLGLVYVEPVALEEAYDDHLATVGEVTWQPIARDDDAFFAFLSEVIELLGRHVPPEPSSSCSFCQYLQDGIRHAAS